MQVKTKNIIVTALVVALVGMLWYRVVYSPMQSKTSKAKAAAHDADTQSAGLRQTLNGSSSAKSKTKPASTQSLLTAVPNDPAEAAFLRDLEAIRLSSGADWQTVTPGVPAPAAGGTTAVTLGITATGTEAEITRYLEELTALKRVFVVDNVAITQGGSKTPAGTVSSGPAAGAVFVGDLEQVTISGRIFSTGTGVVSAPTGASGSATTPTTGAPAPTGAAAPTGTVNG